VPARLFPRANGSWGGSRAALGDPAFAKNGVAVTRPSGSRRGVRRRRPWFESLPFCVARVAKARAACPAEGSTRTYARDPQGTKLAARRLPGANGSNPIGDTAIVLSARSEQCVGSRH